MRKIDKVIAAEKEQEHARLSKVREELRSGVRPGNVCDKCGRPVQFENDATVLDAYMGNSFAMFAIPRHLLPVVENGVTVCEGSPSRAQYLPGQARDKRIAYHYRPDSESKWREAYELMQRATMARNAEQN